MDEHRPIANGRFLYNVSSICPIFTLAQSSLGLEGLEMDRGARTVRIVVVVVFVINTRHGRRGDWNGGHL